MATGSASLRGSEEESEALDVQMMPHESDTCPSDVSPNDIDKDSMNQIYKECTTMPPIGDRRPPEGNLRTDEGRR